MRKHHLRMAKEWLKLAEGPILSAQIAVGKALGVYFGSWDAVGMINTTDLAHATNTALTWANHALDLALGLLEEKEFTEETIAKLVRDTSATHRCDRCGREYSGNANLEVGFLCTDCGRGLLELVVEPSEYVPASYYVCGSCNTQYTFETSVKVGDDCLVCDEGVVGVIVKPLVFEPTDQYLCDYCAQVYTVGGNLEVGDACTQCDDGSIVVAEKPLGSEPAAYYVCGSCGWVKRLKDDVEVGEDCPKCDHGHIIVAMPF